MDGQTEENSELNKEIIRIVIEHGAKLKKSDFVASQTIFLGQKTGTLWRITLTQKNAELEKLN